MGYEYGTIDSARRTAWLELGIKAEGNITPQQARKLAFDWEPERRTLIDGETFDPITTHKKLVRSDTGAQLGIVGEGFGTIPNGSLTELAEATGLDCVTAGQRKGGKQVWMLLDMGEKDFGHGEVNHRYLWIANSHDGSASLMVKPTNVRLFCSNQFDAVRRNSDSVITVRHTRNAMDYVAIAQQTLRSAFLEFDALDNEIEQLMATEFSRRDFLDTMVPAVLGEQPEWEETTTGTGGAKRTNWGKRWDELVWTYASETQDGIRNTAYGAVMAVNEWEQHVKPGRGSKAEIAANRIVDGLPLTRRAMEVVAAL